jgi:hypothetical protein
MHACLCLQSAKPTLLLATINAVFFEEKKLQQKIIFLGKTTIHSVKTMSKQWSGTFALRAPGDQNQKKPIWT